MNVVFLSNFENKAGTNRPQMAIVNVNELTYNPETAIEVLKYVEICEIMPTILRGVLIPSVANINMYNNILGLFFIKKRRLEMLFFNNKSMILCFGYKHGSVFTNYFFGFLYNEFI